MNPDLAVSKFTRLRLRNELTYPYPDILSVWTSCLCI